MNVIILEKTLNLLPSQTIEHFMNKGCELDLTAQDRVGKRVLYNKKQFKTYKDT